MKLLVTSITLVLLALGVATANRHKHKVHPQQKLGMLTLVDTKEDLRRSACNSGSWFKYAKSTSEIRRAPPVVSEGLKDAVGVWWLEHEPYRRLRLDNKEPCMEVSTSALLSTEYEITYWFHSEADSNFSVFNYNGDKLLAKIETSSAQENGSPKWQVLKVADNGNLLHGIKITASINKDDFLLIDKIAAQFDQ